MLQLRAGNLTRTLNPIMEHLETLHRNGLVGLDLSRNMIVGTLPRRLTELKNLQLLLLGANSGCDVLCCAVACCACCLTLRKAARLPVCLSDPVHPTTTLNPRDPHPTSLSR